MKNIYGAMSDDGRIARVTIQDAGASKADIDLTADELGMAIRGLSNVRAAMADKVPRRLDPGAPVFSDVTRAPFFVVGRQHQVSKEVYLALRHEGFGWLAFTFEEMPGAQLVLSMSETIAGMRPRIAVPPKPGIIL